MREYRVLISSFCRPLRFALRWALGLATLGLLYCVASFAESSPATFPTNRISQVVVPHAAVCAVSERHSLLVVGAIGDAAEALWVYTLDENGVPLEASARAVPLPAPATLAGVGRAALALIFHPSQPLLYVWQDVSTQKLDVAQQAAMYDTFDHLVVMTVTNAELVQKGGFARGPTFASGQTYAAITVPPDGSRVFLPNLRVPTSPPKEQQAVGYYDLDDAGMPVPVPVPIKGSLDGHGLNRFEQKMVATKIHLGQVQGYPIGYGFFAPSRRVLLFGGAYGPILWDTENRRGALAALYVRSMGTDVLIGGDPAIPAVFGATLGGDSMIRVELAEGFPTLAPQMITVSSAKFQSPPLVMPGRPHRLAVGDVNAVRIIPLDPENRLTAAAQVVPLIQDSVRAIAYSAKFQRLYVAVDRKGK